MQVDALVFFRVTDPRIAVFKIQNVPDSLELLTQATLRNTIAKMSLDDTFSSREEIDHELLSAIRPDAARWGITVTRVEIFNISPPGDIKVEMENQIKAERERRSHVLAGMCIRIVEVFEVEWGGSKAQYHISHDRSLYFISQLTERRMLLS